METKKQLRVIYDDCVYSDGEITSTGSHSFDKKGFCNVCGKTKEQAEIRLRLLGYYEKKNQIGCGYCAKEKICLIRDPKINKAKAGCKDWQHWQDYNL